MYDIIIIGAGISGLTSAIYGLNANKKVLVIDQNGYGGQIMNSLGVDNYPGFSSISGFDLMKNIYEQAEQLGLEIRYEKVGKITEEKQVILSSETLQAKTIILATGLISRRLGLENEERLVGKGISYCATCDGFFYKNKTVAVVGGGNTAFEDAIYLSNLCKKVYLIHRREEFRGEEKTLQLIGQKENIEVITKAIVTGIKGDDKLTSITIKNKEQEEELEVDGLFLAIGKIPENEIVKDLIELTEDGFIKSDESCHTNIDGIFVAGDIRDKKVRQLVTAASDGAVAAIEAVNYINEEFRINTWLKDLSFYIGKVYILVNK